MSGPRCWRCNRKMRLNFDGKTNSYWLHCGPCAATYMDTKGNDKDTFLAHYGRFYRKERNGNQMEMEMGV